MSAILRLLILRGIPGSGKTHFTRHNMPAPDAVCSADDFFVELGGGQYKFDPSRLGEAHGQCLRKALDAMQRKLPFVVIDNTSTSVVEVAPYAALGQALGYEVSIITLYAPPLLASKRNTHGVGLSACARMDEALHKGTEAMPPWWDHTQLAWDEEDEKYLPVPETKAA